MITNQLLVEFKLMTAMDIVYSSWKGSLMNDHRERSHIPFTDINNLSELIILAYHELKIEEG